MRESNDFRRSALIGPQPVDGTYPYDSVGYELLCCSLRPLQILRSLDPHGRVGVLQSPCQYVISDKAAQEGARGFMLHENPTTQAVSRAERRAVPEAETKKTVVLIVAADSTGAIGKNGKLPWHLPRDLKFFKDVTLGYPVVMGRKTHESIGRALPNRQNIVVSRDKEFQPAEGCAVADTVEGALKLAALETDSEKVMVIGGAEIFSQTLPYADRIYLTRVHARLPADTFLPAIDWDEWEEAWREDHPADTANPYAYSFIQLDRRRAARR